MVPTATQTRSIILAAGKGKRMNSDLPKVLHRVAGRPMVLWVLEAARAAGADRHAVVVGYRAADVRAALEGEADVEFVEQTEQLGTGHAVMVAEPLFAGHADNPTEVFVLAGDMPLLRGETLSRLLQAHRDAGAAGSLATAKMPDPTGYGRIVRDEAGDFVRIVEQKDATEPELAITEVNVSCYCFEAAALFDALKRIDRSNAQGEFYLTDALGVLRGEGRTVIAAPIVPSDEAEGINNPDQLARVDDQLRQRTKGAPLT